MLGVDIGTSGVKNVPQNNSLLNESEKIRYVASIDIGTNSTHLLIAAVDTSLKTFTVEFAEKSTTRLGEKDLLTGELTQHAMGRVLETLKRFKALAESHNVEDVLVAATSAVREAPNGGDFISKVRTQIDLDVEVISGTEEARLIYLGVLSGMPFGEYAHVLIDIGGGSTELILADGDDSRALTSTKIGAVRLKTEFIKEQPLSNQGSDFLKTFIQWSLEPAVTKISSRLKPSEKPLMVATSGTAMAIGTLISRAESSSKGKLQGYKVSKFELDQLIERLLKMSPEQLKNSTPLSERRAEIIVPGALILQEAMKMLQVNEVMLSERALREGLVVDWMFRHGLLDDRLSLQGSIRQRTVLHQAKRFRVNLHRSERVAKNALTLYDNTYGVLHDDKGEGRELLWAAALLHACGQHINLGSYHKHSWYLIRHGELLGYSHIEHLMVASIVRYHRKSFPKKRHEAWQCLGGRHYRQIVSDMSLLLRLSASLDRRPEPVVDSIVINSTISSKTLSIKLIPVTTGQDLGLEQWNLQNTILRSGENIRVKIVVET